MKISRYLAIIAAAVSVAAIAQETMPHQHPKPKLGPEIKLFNGKNLDGWTYCLTDKKLKMDDVWSVDPKQGIIICKGVPAGYIRTTRDFTNFVLKLQWRWAPGTKGSNSGVLIRMTGPDKVWPKSYEAQLMAGHAGDFYLIDGVKLDTAPERADPRAGNHKIAVKSAEKPIPEWNEYEIIANGDRITLKVNGELLNEGWNADVVPGKILLQSEGGEIHFRNIRLREIQP